MEVLAIRLLGGPGKLADWHQAYPLPQLGGWPPPERLAAFEIHGSVAVALPDRVPDAEKDKMTFFHKIAQSELEEGVENFLRGATYEVET